MNEIHGTDVFTEESRVVDGGNVYERKGDHLEIKVGGEADWRREMEQRGQAISDAMGRFRGTEPLIEAVGRLADDYHAALLADTVLREVGDELTKARATHAPMNGHHEGYAVMLEEMDELWELCKLNTHKFGSDAATRVEQRKFKREAMRKEALQIAAMAIRFIEDVCDKD